MRTIFRFDAGTGAPGTYGTRPTFALALDAARALVCPSAPGSAPVRRIGPCALVGAIGPERGSAPLVEVFPEDTDSNS